MELRNHVRNFKGDLICLVETKVKQEKAVSIAQLICPGCNFIGNYEATASGRIWLLYRGHLVVNIHEVTSQVIRCHVCCSISKEYCFVSNVYAADLYTQREKLWNSLKRVKHNMIAAPWLLMADFNVILKIEDRSDYEEGMILSFDERSFSECVSQLEVVS